MKTVNQVFPKREQGLTVGEYFLFGILTRLTRPMTKNSIQGWYTSKEIDKIYPVDPQFLMVRNYWNNMASLDLKKVNELHHLLMQSINRRLFNFLGFVEKVSDFDQDKNALSILIA